MPTSQPETKFFLRYLLLGNILAAQEATSFRVPVVRLNLTSQFDFTSFACHVTKKGGRQDSAHRAYMQAACIEAPKIHVLWHLQVSTCMYTAGADACGADSQCQL